MTQDEIMEMYLEVLNKICNGTEWCWTGVGEPLQLFAKLVAAKEREACAKVCDGREKDFIDLFNKYGHEEDSGAIGASMQCAKAIRARGEQA